AAINANRTHGGARLPLLLLLDGSFPRRSSDAAKLREEEEKQRSGSRRMLTPSCRRLARARAAL
ncbi:Hypothetical predicted protein, partial [Podarcis lilfordi]